MLTFIDGEPLKARLLLRGLTVLTTNQHRSCLAEQCFNQRRYRLDISVDISVNEYVVKHRNETVYHS